MLANEPIVDQVHCKLRHPLPGWGLFVDETAPIQSRVLQFGVSHDEVHHPHGRSLVCRMVLPEEEHFPCPFLPDHSCEVCRTVAAIEAGDVGVGLFEDGVFTACDGEVADDVEAVAAADSPPRHDRNDDLGHKSDESLYFEDVQAPGSRRVDSIAGFTVGVLVAASATDPLVASRTEGPAAIFWRWPVAGHEYTSNVARHTCVIQTAIELVYGVGSKGISYLGSIEGNPHRSMGMCPVVGDVIEILKSLDRAPLRVIKNVRNHYWTVAALILGHGHESILRVPPILRRSGVLALIVLGVLFLVSGPLTAQDDVERLEELEAEREVVLEELAAAAALVDVSQASFEEVAAALDAINGLVDLHQARLEDATQALASAELLVDQAEARREAIEEEAVELRGLVAELAVESFTGENAANGEDLTAFLLSDDPTEAVRRRSLVEFQTGNLGDSLDRLRLLEVEAEQVEAERQRAVDAAVANRQEQLVREEELAMSQDQQVQRVLDVEARLEARLAEAQAVRAFDEELAAEIQQQEEVIAARIRAEAAAKAAAEAAARAAAEAASRPPLTPSGEIVNASGFQVHESVASRVTSMITAASGDGVTLTGSGWRSPERTAELRVINGCPDVYNASPSSCRIPTARPGQSQHERGLAIDFRNCWRGSECFTWLSNNASTYDFFNLPSESWHWSTTGG